MEAREVIVAGLDVGHSSLEQGTVTPCPLLLIFLANSNATTTPPLPGPISHLTTHVMLKHCCSVYHGGKNDVCGRGGEKASVL
jgi:hypothetical protein